jgi:hypothetical protein
MCYCHTYFGICDLGIQYQSVILNLRSCWKYSSEEDIYFNQLFSAGYCCKVQYSWHSYMLYALVDVVFWFAMLCRLVDRYQHHCLHLQPWRWRSMSEMLVSVSKSTQKYNPEDQHWYLHPLENLRSCILYTVVSFCWQSQRDISEEIAVSSIEWCQRCWDQWGTSDRSALSVQLFFE